MHFKQNLHLYYALSKQQYMTVISRCHVVAMFDITTNALQTVRYQLPGAVAVRYLARYRTAIYPKATDIALLKQMF